MSAQVALEGVTLGYERQPAVRRLDVAFPAGSLTAVVGPNGAGKSTLLKGLVGELQPMEGQIILPARSTAYLPQQSAVDRSFPISVAELVAMGLWRRLGPFGGLTRANRRRIAEALAAVGLTGFEHRSLSALSGGQMQRVLFARLLLQEADVLLLDEPFTAIDSRTATDLLGVIGRWHEEGKTIIAVLHDLETVRTRFPTTLLLARDLVAHGATSTVLTAENLMRARQMCEACADEDHSCGRPANRPWRM
ncbi:MAG: zinc ABC transporter ATP-binding protein AztA [Pseudomonadota bacterium]